MRAKALAYCCLALLLAMPVRLLGQESLAEARRLYAAAEYQSALAMLGGLLAADPSPQERQSIELYRIFCLFAVDNGDEANSALEAMILRDPMFRPSEEVVPRRLRAAFSEARMRLLPEIVQEKYLVAKTAFDRGDFTVASEGFTQALEVLSDPDIAALARQRPLADLRVLASGFHDLSIRASAPPTVPEVDAPAAAPATVESGPRIYQAGEAGVSMPAVVRQDLPAYPLTVVANRTGYLEVVIDEAGAVESARMLTAFDPRYNQMVLAAAKFWRYRPATVDGVPVKFKKRIQLTLSPDR